MPVELILAMNPVWLLETMTWAVAFTWGKSSASVVPAKMALPALSTAMALLLV